jgi:type I restriction enzyme, S subunit
MSEWRKIKLSEIAILRRDGTVPNEFQSFPYIGLEHIEPKGLRLNSIGKSSDVTSQKSKFYPSDILYGKLRPYFQKVYYPSFEGICSTDIFVIKAKNGIDSKFLFYLIASDEFTNLANNGSTGTRMPRADWKHLSSTIWNIPPLPTQKVIAEILSSLDDKIELNNQINQNLEALAQVLFKQWFVDFEYPNENGEPYKSSGGEMIDSELGEIPNGWEVCPLSQIIEVKHGYAFKGEFFSDSETEDILVTPGNFKIGGGFNYGKFKFYEGEFPIEYLMNFEDLIVTMTDLSKEGDTLGLPALVPKILGKKLLHNQRIGKVIFRETPDLKYFLYMLMRTANYRAFVLSGASGTTVRHTSPSRICEFKYPIPPLEILKRFEEVVSPLFKAEVENNYESSITSRLRDTLLPKLISGELEVNQIEDGVYG